MMSVAHIPVDDLCAIDTLRAIAAETLEAAGLPDHAAALRALAPIVDGPTAVVAQEATWAAREAAAAMFAAVEASLAWRWASWAPDPARPWEAAVAREGATWKARAMAAGAAREAAGAAREAAGAASTAAYEAVVAFRSENSTVMAARAMDVAVVGRDVFEARAAARAARAAVEVAKWARTARARAVVRVPN